MTSEHGEVAKPGRLDAIMKGEKPCSGIKVSTFSPPPPVRELTHDRGDAIFAKVTTWARP